MEHMQRAIPPERKKTMRARVYIALQAVVLLILGGCAGPWRLESYRPILGEWETERGIIVSIHMTGNKTSEASVKLSPGYDSDDIQYGDAVVMDITPLVEGGYAGMFVMPDGLKPVKVKLGLVSRDTLMIITWDSRVKNKAIRWNRVKQPQTR